MKTIVCVSGGISSTILFEKIAKERGKINIIYSDIGQKANLKEIESIEYLCEKYKDKIENKYMLNHKNFSTINENSLVFDDIKVPLGDLRNKKTTFDYIPLWITRILTEAVAIAYKIGTQSAPVNIYIGLHEKDNFNNPEYNRLFISLFNKIVEYGLPYRRFIKIIVPFINYSYDQIISLGKKLKTDFDKTWSCYDKCDTPCGKCNKCLLREKYLS